MRCLPSQERPADHAGAQRRCWVTVPTIPTLIAGSFENEESVRCWPAEIRTMEADLVCIAGSWSGHRAGFTSTAVSKSDMNVAMTFMKLSLLWRVP